MLKASVNSQFSLPFAIDENDFGLWLNALSQQNGVKSCEQILQVLLTLNKNYQAVAGKTRLFFLKRLGKLLFELLDQLTGAEHIDKTHAYLSTWSCSELANAYILLSEDPRFSGSDYYYCREKVEIISLGFAAMARALLHTSQAYARAYTYFWIKCYQLYQIARQEQLTETSFAAGQVDYAEIAAVDRGFKHILVLHLSNLNQFTPPQMRLIHELLRPYAAQARFLTTVPEKKFTGIPFINFKNDLPPAIPAAAPELASDQDTIHVATGMIARNILQDLKDKNRHFSHLERHLLTRLARILTSSHQRKHAREQDTSKHFGVIGFANLVSFLAGQQQEPDMAIGQPDLSRPGELRELNFEVLSHEQTLDYVITNKYSAKNIRDRLRFNPAETWDTHKKQRFAANATQIDKSNFGYGLVWQDETIEPEVGEIIGVQNQTPSVGLIRWIAQSADQVWLFGVELIGHNAQAVKVFNSGGLDQQVDALYLVTRQQTAEPVETLITANNFEPADFVYVRYHKDLQRYRIIRVTQTTPMLKFIHIVLS